MSGLQSDRLGWDGRGGPAVQVGGGGLGGGSEGAGEPAGGGPAPLRHHAPPAVRTLTVLPLCTLPLPLCTLPLPLYTLLLHATPLHLPLPLCTLLLHATPLHPAPAPLYPAPSCYPCH